MEEELITILMHGKTPYAYYICDGVLGIRALRSKKDKEYYPSLPRYTGIDYDADLADLGIKWYDYTRSIFKNCMFKSIGSVQEIYDNSKKLYGMYITDLHRFGDNWANVVIRIYRQYYMEVMDFEAFNKDYGLLKDFYSVFIADMQAYGNRGSKWEKLVMGFMPEYNFKENFTEFISLYNCVKDFYSVYMSDLEKFGSKWESSVEGLIKKFNFWSEFSEFAGAYNRARVIFAEYLGDLGLGEDWVRLVKALEKYYRWKKSFNGFEDDYRYMKGLFLDKDNSIGNRLFIIKTRRSHNVEHMRSRDYYQAWHVCNGIISEIDGFDGGTVERVLWSNFMDVTTDIFTKDTKVYGDEFLVYLAGKLYDGMPLQEFLDMYNSFKIDWLSQYRWLRNPSFNKCFCDVYRYYEGEDCVCPDLDSMSDFDRVGFVEGYLFPHIGDNEEILNFLITGIIDVKYAFRKPLPELNATNNDGRKFSRYDDIVYSEGFKDMPRGSVQFKMTLSVQCHISVDVRVIKESQRILALGLLRKFYEHYRKLYVSSCKKCKPKERLNVRWHWLKVYDMKFFSRETLLMVDIGLIEDIVQLQEKELERRTDLYNKKHGICD